MNDLLTYFIYNYIIRITLTIIITPENFIRDHIHRVSSFRHNKKSIVNRII